MNVDGQEQTSPTGAFTNDVLPSTNSNSGTSFSKGLDPILDPIMDTRKWPALGIKKTPDSLAMDKIWKNALKMKGEFKSPIVPNLNHKRRRAENNLSEGHPATEQYTTPRKVMKAAKTVPQHPKPIEKKNKFMVLGEGLSSPEDASFNSLPDISRSRSQDRRLNRENIRTTTKDSEITSTPPAPVDGQPSITNQQQPAEDKASARVRTPLITTCGVSLKEAITILTPKVGKGEYFVKKRDEKVLSIHAQTMAAYDKIKTVLSENNCKYYTYTPKHLKNKNYVLKGISEEYTAKEVEAEIIALNIPDVKLIKVSELSFSKGKAGPRKLLAQFSNESNTQNLVKVKHILYQGVKWEPLRKRALYQCRRCQRVGHASTNCQLEYRCVKCKGPHKPGECQLPKESTDRKNLYCVNCDRYGHPASYQGCPFLKLYSSIQSNVKRQNTQRRDTKISTIDNRTGKGPSPLRDPARLYSQVTDSNISPALTNPTVNSPTEGKGDLYSFLNNFKQEILKCIDSKIENLKETISSNSARIDALCDAYDCEDGGY